jgi:hypothetical protein
LSQRIHEALQNTSFRDTSFRHQSTIPLFQTSSVVVAIFRLGGAEHRHSTVPEHPKQDKRGEIFGYHSVYCCKTSTNCFSFPSCWFLGEGRFGDRENSNGPARSWADGTGSRNSMFLVTPNNLQASFQTQESSQTERSYIYRP